MQQSSLFTETNVYPEGFSCQEDFLTRAFETKLLDHIRTLSFRDAPYKEWTAKRRIVSYGGSYDFTRNKLLNADPIPAWLFELRVLVAEWSRERAEDFNHAIINEYQTGTQLGWHRDVPNFETVVGVSLAGHGRMRLRPYPHTNNARAAVNVELPPRSIYLLSGPARWDWQHAISPTKCLRYSITFRTLRQ